MAEVLSQAEIQALLAAIGQDPLAETGPAGEVTDRGRRVKAYDFRRPDKLSKEQLRTLQIMHDSFARLLGTSLSGYLRTVVEAEVVSVEQVTYEEFIRTLSNPTILAVFTFPPLEGSGLLEVNPDVGFVIMERLLGGPGSVPKRIRELTDLEQTVMRRILRRALESFQEAWSNVTAIEPRLERLEANPHFTQLVPPRDMVVVVGIVLRLRGVEGKLTVCIPYLALEPVISKLSAHYLFASGQRTERGAHTEVLKRRLQSLRVPLAVILGHSTIAVRELLALEAGDVIRLDTRQGGELDVLIGERVKFRARPGRVGSHLAVEITDKVEEAD